MTIAWRYENRTGLGVLHVTGFLGAASASRFRGAVGWALARGTGPLILDLTALRGIDAVGLWDVSVAARRLAEHGRVVELCGTLSEADLRFLSSSIGEVYPSLQEALAAHTGADTDPDDGQELESWRTDDWQFPESLT